MFKSSKDNLVYYYTFEKDFGFTEYNRPYIQPYGWF